MLKQLWEDFKSFYFPIQSFFLAKFIHAALFLLIKSCRLEVEGLSRFQSIVKNGKAILILWHNRLAPVLFILDRFTPNIYYTAVVSGSKDGAVLSNIISSYKKGKTIRVPHHSRYQALRAIVETVKKGDEVLVITPDGPRGPRYRVKPGTALAALETQATVIPLDWVADSYWEFNTWDKFRLPKPFTTIRATFGEGVKFDQHPLPKLKEAEQILEEILKTGQSPSA